jgi:hypothetical protein
LASAAASDLGREELTCGAGGSTVLSVSTAEDTGAFVYRLARAGGRERLSWRDRSALATDGLEWLPHHGKGAQVEALGEQSALPNEQQESGGQKG